MARVVINDISYSDVIKTVTFILDTSAYGDGDLLADRLEIATVGKEAGNIVTLDSLVILDKADQKQPLTVVFLNVNTSLGTENAAPSITDANAESIVGHVKVAATDYQDVGGAAVACVRNIGLKMQCASAAASLYVGLISGGTGTYGASDLIAKFGFRRS